MQITVKVKNIEIHIDDKDNNSVIKWESHNKQVQKTIKIMVNETIRLIKESNGL